MDDAVISLGGYIKLCKDPVSVIDVFSNDPWIKPGFITGRTDDAIKARKKEELRNQKMYSYHLEFWDFAAAWMGRGYLSWQDNVNWSNDARLIKALERRILDTVSWGKFTTVIFPLAIGGHTDHVICNHIALSIGENCRRKFKTLFFEDMPYATNPTLWPKSPLWSQIVNKKMKARRFNVAEVVMLKNKAISNYNSQFNKEKLDRIAHFLYKQNNDNKLHKFKEKYLKQHYLIEERLWEFLT